MERTCSVVLGSVYLRGGSGSSLKDGAVTSDDLLFGRSSKVHYVDSGVNQSSMALSSRSLDSAPSNNFLSEVSQLNVTYGEKDLRRYTCSLK